jgi:glycosyltransferase involved in cell wall biosynthesis
MIRLLHVSEFIKGGVSTYLNTLVREQLQDSRFSEIRIIASRQHRHFLPDVPDRNLVLYDYPRRSLAGLNHLSKVVRNTVRDFRPTLVQLTSTFPGVIGRVNMWNRRWLCAKESPAVVYCAQGWSFLMDTGAVKRFAYRNVERLLSSRTDRIICISHHELQAAVNAGISRDRCDLVYNALPSIPPSPEPVKIPEAAAAARNRGNRVFLFVGRYDKQKGLDLLRPVFDGPVDDGDILLTAGGMAVDSVPVRMGSRMLDTGWATPGQVVELLKHCDALIVPSRWEGFGLVAAEAMRAGKAVICSNRGGLPEVVSNGVTGIVLPRLDSETISRVIAEVTDAQLTSFGIAGAERFQHMFASDKMHARTVQVYLSAIDHARHRSRSVGSPTLPSVR